MGTYQQSEIKAHTNACERETGTCSYMPGFSTNISRSEIGSSYAPTKTTCDVVACCDAQEGWKSCCWGFPVSCCAQRGAKTHSTEAEGSGACHGTAWYCQPGVAL